MHRMKNNFMIGTIIAFLKTIRRYPNICMLGINYTTGLSLLTITKLRDALLKNEYIRKKDVNARRTDLVLTLKGKRFVRELMLLQ